MAATEPPGLYPIQVCFVVDDVPSAVAECEERFGWGPFDQFSAPVAEARYHGWSGSKLTDVALGMAGAVQVELIHVHEGRDTVGVYQEAYGPGFPHLGIHCRDRDHAIAALETMGGRLDDQTEHEGIRIAFIDVPSGPGMFELLQPTEAAAPPGRRERPNERTGSAPPRVEIDRATIVDAQFDEALRFHSNAFGWSDVVAEERTLRFGGETARLRRARARAGKLVLELIEPLPESRDPYTQHALRGDHGLVHAGGSAPVGFAAAPGLLECEWLEDGERFTIHDWAGGPGTLALRH